MKHGAFSQFRARKTIKKVEGAPKMDGDIMCLMSREQYRGTLEFWVKGLILDPADRAIEQHSRQSTGTYSLAAQLDGRYTYCFSNQFSTVTEKIVSFNVHGVVYVQGDDGSNSHTDPLEKEIRELADGLAAIRDEQEYIVIRERVHRDTAESTNDRVKWWSLFQFIVLVSVCLWQVFYLKRFFEVKR
ncbi:5785_t:CDS:2, partial [Ambispora leptoticha]